MEHNKIFRINLDKQKEATPIKRFTFNYQPKIEKNKDFTYTSHCNIACLIQEKYEELIYSNLKQIAEEEGVSEVVVIDREFVKAALLSEMGKRENTHEDCNYIDNKNEKNVILSTSLVYSGKELCELVKKLEYQGWKDNSPELEQAALLIKQLFELKNRFYERYVYWKHLHSSLCREYAELKNRIGVLENATKDINNVNTDIGDELTKKQALVQFTDRLKRKIKTRRQIDMLMLMPERDVALSTIEGLWQDIDETLKEFINERKM